MIKNTFLAICFFQVICDLTGYGSVYASFDGKEGVGSDINETVSNVVLPGFDPVVLDGQSVFLGAGRKYQWDESLFPSTFAIDGLDVAGPITLDLHIKGQRVALDFVDFKVNSRSRTAVEVQTTSRYRDVLELVAKTRIEYDGVAMVQLAINPLQEVTVDKLTVRMPVSRNQYTTMLAYRADTIRSRTRQLVYPLSYKGDFLNAVAFPNGENSFWFFADNAEGWIWNGENVTEVNASEDEVILSQHLIGGEFKIDQKMVFNFNYLLTPVKEIQPDSRDDRIARRVSQEEAKYAGTQLWWTTAFAHIDYPYTKLDNSVFKLVPKKDIEVYPGLNANKKNLKSWRKLGIERLPYFSAHALSTLDPELQKERSDWEVQPPFVMPAKSDGPFTAKLAKPWLSHRAKGYSDYLIDRFDHLIDELGIEGIYFDQGGVIDSKNAAHDGLWIDSNGKRQASLDILGLRDFFKRLATLFYAKGKEGRIVVHNSMSAIIPGYTHVESLVQGEEYNHFLKDLDYISSTPLSDARSKFSGHQYGLSVTWLSELWNPKVADGRREGQRVDDWMSSDKFRRAFRNFMAIALVNDSRIFSVAPYNQREEIYEAFDRFDVEQSILHGYWINNIALHEDVKSTFYKNSITGGYLAVVANLSDDAVSFDVSSLAQAIDNRLSANIFFRTSKEKQFKTLGSEDQNLKINTKDYLIIEIKPMVEESSSL